MHLRSTVPKSWRKIKAKNPQNKTQNTRFSTGQRDARTKAIKVPVKYSRPTSGTGSYQQQGRCLTGSCLRIWPSCLHAPTSHTQYACFVWQSCSLSLLPQASRCTRKHGHHVHTQSWFPVWYPDGGTSCSICLWQSVFPQTRPRGINGSFTSPHTLILDFTWLSFPFLKCNNGKHMFSMADHQGSLHLCDTI